MSRNNQIITKNGPAKINNSFLPDIVQDAVIEWLIYHNYDKMTSNQSIDERMWAENFLQKYREYWIPIIAASYNLGIFNLQLAASNKVAQMIMNKSPEQIRQMFNIENDLDDEDDEEY